MRVIEMSRRPPLMNDSASLRLVSGVTKPGCCGVVLDQLVLEGAERKNQFSSSISMSGTAVDRAVAVDAGLDGVVVLAADAVEALVDVLVDVAVVVDRGEELLHALVVPRLGRADEVVELMSRAAQAWRNCSDLRSVHSWGDWPFFAAASATFWPCSSVPVRNFVSSPISRCQRARASALTVV